MSLRTRASSSAWGIRSPTMRSSSPSQAAPRPLVLDAVNATSGRTLAILRSGTRFGYGEAPTDVVLAGRSVWLLLPTEQRLLRVDARTHQLRATFRLPWVPLARLAAVTSEAP